MCKLKKTGFLYLMLLMSSLALNACSTEDELILEDQPNQEEESETSAQIVKEVMMSAGDILSGNSQSRTSLELADDKLVFAWAENDKIGVFPSEGTQIAFTIKKGAGKNTAGFDGGAWALRETETYAAYYPYDVNNTDRSNAELRFCYEGQHQTGNASLAHLGKYDLMATNATSSEDGKLNFKFDHLNSVAQIRLTMPVAVSVLAMTIKCNEAVFTNVANLDLSGTAYSYSSHEMTNQLRLKLTDVATTEKNKEVICYMMLPPVDLSGKIVDVVLHGDNDRVYQGQLPSKNLKAGFAYTMSSSMRDVTVSSTVTAPDFGDKDTEY